MSLAGRWRAWCVKCGSWPGPGLVVARFRPVHPATQAPSERPAQANIPSSCSARTPSPRRRSRPSFTGPISDALETLEALVRELRAQRKAREEQTP